ncbi:MAG: DegV family protein [Candidatus Heimdallarchaeota archaeon]|nr:DegV family protein [Candidatus Heimdallarchaeota archaeon]MDH5644400.1 DegV family protein [Candidatus Heimdallarchaeota archaeon]
MVRIVTDSASDIPNIIANQLNITVVPAHILFGRTKFLDGVTLTTPEFYDKLTSSSLHPLTTQASPYEFFEVFKEIEETGEDILVITLPRKVSVFIEAAELASKHIKKVKIKVISSTGVSGYQGVLVIQAARLANMGYDLDYIASRIKENSETTNLYSVANVFDYLVRGGRVSVTRGRLGGLLGINPVLKMVDEAVENVGKPKGIEEAIDFIINSMKRDYSKEEPLMAIVLHALNPSAMVNLSEKLIKNFNMVELLHGSIGPTIGANIGPGAFGIGVSSIPHELRSSR